jgi:hypothetical protein
LQWHVKQEELGKRYYNLKRAGTGLDSESAKKHFINLISKGLHPSQKEGFAERSRSIQILKLNEGTHISQKEGHMDYMRQKSKEKVLDLISKNEHPAQKDEFKEYLRKYQRELLDKGIHTSQRPESIKKIRQARKREVENGTHNFLGLLNPVHNQLKNGTHIFQSLEFQANRSEIQKERVENKTHNLLGPQSNLKMLADGVHSSQKEYICHHCGKVGKGTTMMARWHFDNCKENPFNQNYWGA